jgi:hypothetical protein
MLSTPIVMALAGRPQKKLNLKRRLMKKNVLKIKPFLTLPFLALLALIGSTLQSQAQFPQGNYQNNFAVGANTSPFAGSGSGASWIYWYNTPGGNSPITNDVTTPDPAGGAGAGSLQIFSPFLPNTTNETQNVFFGTFGNGGGYDFSQEVNLLNFTNVAFDIYVGTNNQPNTDGNFGQLGVGVITSGYGYEQFNNGEIPIPAAASNGWVHISVPIDHTLAGITTIPGIAFDFNNYAGDYPTNTFTFWIGNLTMGYSGAPPPNPIASISKAVPGLTQFADSKPSYNRQDLRTDMSGTADVTWFNHPGASYSFTIAAFPGPSNPNFLAGLNLSPELTNCADLDWTGTNDIWVAMQNNADGTVTAGIAYKTNQPVQNSQFNGPPGQLVNYRNEATGLTVPSAIGTWSVTFNNNTSITLTAPNGASTNVTIPDYVAAPYNGYVAAVLYSSPQNDANVGQYCTFSAFNITGVGTPVHENLTSGGLTSPFLQTISQNYFYTGNYTNHPPDQVFATSAANIYWLAWTLPDAGFSPVAGTVLGSPGLWTTLSGNIFQNGGQHWMAIGPSQLQGATTGFYALIKRVPYQLQVLLPGETNAPNTVSGKIGTPIAQSLSTETFVTINMCDQNWNIVNSSDQVKLTSSDLTADLPSPDGFLVNGTLTEGMFFGTQSPPQYTVSASDDTTPSILSNTSSPVTVGP